MRLFYTDFHGISGHDAAYALLRFAFSEIYGEATPETAKTDDGKPYFPTRSDVHFSLSHTKDYVLCAMGDFPVGADIEKIRELRPGLNKRVRSEDEMNDFDFFSSWVLKESFIKLCGTIEIPLRETRFTGTPENIVCPREGVFAKLYETVDGYRTAVCSYTSNLPKNAEFIPFNTLFGIQKENS